LLSRWSVAWKDLCLLQDFTQDEWVSVDKNTRKSDSEMVDAMQIEEKGGWVERRNGSGNLMRNRSNHGRIE
jgi:hypothetical protein